MTSPPAAALPSSGPTAGKAASRRPAFDLKGMMASLTVLRLRSTDLALIERQLRVKIAQLPHLFLDAPVLIDLGALTDGAADLSFSGLVGALKSCKLVPVAVANLPDGLRSAVTAAGLAVWRPPTTPGRTRRDGDGDPSETLPAESSPTQSVVPARPPSETVPGSTVASALPRSSHAGPMVVTQAVRGGQIVYAQNNDLVVLAPVNSGAQVIADGHVHIYAPLRGRAVAGAQGLPGARIFCQKLEAELVAISGAYIMAEEIPAKMRGKAVQIFLENGECQIAAL
ncbi:MAG TPA: septum site-determining protein MinC [Polyangia bacterium]|nr:septum site-determining protein MinC [Polyangia bacterium]